MDNKKPLILLHGALGSKDQLLPLQELLSSSFSLYPLNFEGHGGRESQRDYSISHFAHNLSELIKQEGLQRPNIFGFSMGGYVALYLAQQHPKMLGKIMTLGTKFNWTPESARQEVKHLDPIKIEDKVPHFAEQLRKRHAPLNWHEVLEKTAKMMLALGNGAAMEYEDLTKVKNEVLISVGGKDQMVSRQESRKAAESLPNGQFYLFEDFKHPIEQVDYKVLAARLREFLN